MIFRGLGFERALRYLRFRDLGLDLTVGRGV